MVQRWRNDRAPVNYDDDDDDDDIYRLETTWLPAGVKPVQGGYCALRAHVVLAVRRASRAKSCTCHVCIVRVPTHIYYVEKV